MDGDVPLVHQSGRGDDAWNGLGDASRGGRHLTHWSNVLRGFLGNFRDSQYRFRCRLEGGLSSRSAGAGLVSGARIPRDGLLTWRRALGRTLLGREWLFASSSVHERQTKR